MNMYPKMFSSTKNIPHTEAKNQKQQQQPYSHPHYNDKPFSEPYNPQDDFDFTQLLRCP